MGGNFKLQAQDSFLEYFFWVIGWFEKRISLSEKSRLLFELLFMSKEQHPPSWRSSNYEIRIFCCQKNLWTLHFFLICKLYFPLNSYVKNLKTTTMICNSKKEKYAIIMGRNCEMRWKQSHYREVSRWGVFSRARQNWKCFLVYKNTFFFI